MAILYRSQPDGKLRSAPGNLDAYDSSVVWLDVLNPTDVELAQLDKIMGFEVPNKRDMSEIELSSRLYMEEGSMVMVASLIPKSDSKALPIRPATFILRENLLVTIRFCEFYSFERAAQKIPRNAERYNSLSIFCLLLDEAVSDRADSLEYSMRHLEVLTSILFSLPLNLTDRKSPPVVESPELDEILKGIGGMGEMVANVRESITSLQRMLNFARAHIPESRLGEAAELFTSLKNDLTALSDEAAFVMNKLSFNLDATLGMINIEEMKVVRVLSIVTLLLAPPTLIAGIYGMNFQIMPELHWPYGYLFSLGLMASTAVGAIWYLKRKRWL